LPRSITTFSDIFSSFLLLGLTVAHKPRREFAEPTPLQDPLQQQNDRRYNAAKRRRLHALGATRSSETDAIRQRGMEGKGQVIEDSHGFLITKNLDNCASIQVR
jgi:hypothetical protein